jgi:hypothetical protein
MAPIMTAARLIPVAAAKRGESPAMRRSYPAAVARKTIATSAVAARAMMNAIVSWVRGTNAGSRACSATMGLIELAMPGARKNSLTR